MTISFGKGINLWNFGVQKTKVKHDGIDYSVAKLRSLYATLLDAIAPDDDVNSSFSPYTGRNSSRRGVTNLHSAESATSRTVRSASLDEEDEISFELFADAANTSLDFAWRRISATTVLFPVDESFESIESSTFNDKESSVAELIHARKLEARVVELIRSIGEIVVYGEQSSKEKSIGSVRRGYGVVGKRGNEAVFEYFCDKNMLSLLVDIAKATPQQQMQYSGVIWTPLVKAQVLQTISMLITNVSDTKSLYYLLSNNYINEVVASMVPLQQFTDKALDEILPVYVSFLKNLALQLTKSQELFQFFCDQNGTTSSLPSFPLFYAAVEVISSPLNVARTDSFISTTVLNVILNICQLQVEEIRVVISKSYLEQRMLFSHICNELVERFEAIAYIVKVGNRTDSTQNAFLGQEVQKLEDQLLFMNDLLWCSHRKMNVRFCEYIMQCAIYYPIIESISGRQSRMESIQGDKKTEDGDEEVSSYSEVEAKSETAVFFLLKIFNAIDYTPFLKMIAVALMHPFAPTGNHFDENSTFGDEFVLTPALNAIAQDEYIVVSEIDDEGNGNFSNAVMENESTTHILTSPDNCGLERERTVTAVSNTTRETLLLMLCGKFGDRSLILATLLFETILNSKATDKSILMRLRLLSSQNEYYCATGGLSPIENALCSYFESLGRFQASKLSSDASAFAISFALCYTDCLFQAIANSGEELKFLVERISKLFSSIKNAQRRSASNCQRIKKVDGISNIFPDLTITEISKLFCVVNTNGPRTKFTCDLLSLPLRVKKGIFATMIQSTESPFRSKRHTDDARYAMRTFLLLNARVHIFTDVLSKFDDAPAEISTRLRSAFLSFQTTCHASEDLVTIGCLDKQSIVGTNIDVRNKTIFYFAPSLAITDGRSIDRSGLHATEKDKRRFLADKILVNGNTKTELIIVVGTTELLVVKPKPRGDKKSGTILCCTLLNNIIAIASDGEWLHIAMCDVEDVGVLINKGNMALRFENSKTCEIAKTCIHQSCGEQKDLISSMIDQMLGEVQ